MAEYKTFTKKYVIAPKKTIGLFCTIVTHSELPNLAFGFISFWQLCKRKGKKQQDARGDNKKGGDRCILYIVQRQVRKQSGCEGRDEIPKAQLQPSHGNGEVWWENEGK